MKKIALIVQRYGLEVNGGAEYHCRILAEKLTSLYEVEVLTSCAKSHVTWANEYPEETTVINGVKVRRFKVHQERDKIRSRRLGKKLGKRSVPQKILKALHLLDRVEKVFNLKTDIEKDSYELAKAQGPFTPGLIRYIEENQQEYEALVFFTYLYFPTIYGIRIAPEKSILIPTAHDEPYIHLPGFKTLFQLPKAILYNTVSEKEFVNGIFDNKNIYSDIVGVGIDHSISENTLTSADILGSADPYLIYIGRIDKAKGCGVMIRYFLRYKKHTKNKVKLVLVGKEFMDIPDNNDILKLGFVDETVKQTILGNAAALIMPSFYESLSLVTLESMQQGVPVIANQNCRVLADHIKNSGAGFSYTDFPGFVMALDAIFENKADLELLKSNGIRYVAENYNWDVVLDKFKRALDFIATH